jgi:ketosteroid isomerase-like protein
MSEENIERLKRMYAAFSRGDLDPLVDWLDDDSEIQRPAGLGMLHGREAIREWLEPDALEQRGEPVEFRVREDQIWVSLDWYARGRGSGAEVESRVFHVWDFRDDRPIRLEIYFDESEALGAAGLSESADD